MSTSAPRGRAQRRDPTAALRDARAVQLRAEGVSTADIATALGCSEGRARHILSRALKRAVSDRVDEYRWLEGHRLDELQQALWPLAVGAGGNTPDAKAAAQVIRIMERRSRLFGLDAPRAVSAGGQVEVVTIDELDAEIERLRAKLAHEVYLPTAEANPA